MDKKAIKAEVAAYAQKSREEIQAELRKQGIDPEEAVRKVRELVNARLHAESVSGGVRYVGK